MSRVTIALCIAFLAVALATMAQRTDWLAFAFSDECKGAEFSDEAEERENDVLYAHAKSLLDRWGGDPNDLCHARLHLLSILRSDRTYALAHVGLARYEMRRGFINGDNYQPPRLTKAQKHLAEAFRINPHLFEAYITAGYVSLKQKDLSGAKQLFAEAEQINPLSVKTSLLAGAIAQREKNYDEARRRAELVVQGTSDDRDLVQAYQILNEVYEINKEYNRAEEMYLAILELNDGAWPRINYSAFLIRRERFDEAIEFAESSLARMDFGMGHHILAKASYKKGEQLLWKNKKAAEARPYFALSVEHDPRDADAWYGLGVATRNVAIVKGDLDLLKESKKAFQHALAIDPKHQLTATVLDGLPRIRHAMQIQPTTAETYYQRGVHFSYGSDHDSALADFRKSIELDPRRFEVYKALDDVLVNYKDWDTIIHYWTRYLSLRRDDAQGYLERAGTQFLKGDLVSSLNDFEMACRLGSQQACDHLRKAQEGGLGGARRTAAESPRAADRE